jgi:hypothetical protein
MKLRTVLVASALSATLAAPAAWAQTPPPPVDGGTNVGGVVPSFIELILAQPSTGFATFPKAKTYTTSFDVQVTTTDPTAVLTLADGDVATGSMLGHLASGKKKLPLPLEASVGKAKFQPLDQTVEPLLTKWTEAAARAKATVNLRQKVAAKASGNYRKVLLVTLSTETP